MVTNKQMLALMLGALTAGASYAIDQESLANATIRKFKNTVATLTPLVNAFKVKAQQGDFEGIAADLSKVDLTPAIQFLADHMDNIKEKMEGFVKILREQAPKAYKAVADATAEKVQEKLAVLDTLKTNLAAVKEYCNLARYQDKIAQALTAANNDKDFRDKLQADIKKSALMLNALLDQIQKIDTDKIQKSLNAAPNLYAAFEQGTLSLAEVEEVVAPGIGELRKKLLPVAPAIAAEISALVMDIYHAFEKKPAVLAQYELPQQVTHALEEINSIGVDLKHDFEGLNIRITELIKEVL